MPSCTRGPPNTPRSEAFLAVDRFLQRGAQVGGAVGDEDAGGAKGGNLVHRAAAAAGDDGAGVAHALAWRRGLARDKGGDGLGDVSRDELGGILFLGAADFA